MKEGNPINIHSLAKEQTEVDVPLAGVLGRALVREYNSNFPLTEGSTYGARWRSLIDRSLQVVTSASSRVAIVATEANSLTAYRASALDWIRTVGAAGFLREVRDGGGQTIGWRHINGSNEVEDYDAAGRVVAVSNGERRFTKIVRDATGHVQEVSDSFGRIVRFSMTSFQRRSQNLELELTCRTGAQYITTLTTPRTEVLWPALRHRS